MGHIVEEGDGLHRGSPFVVNNLVVTDAYDTATNSRNFVVVQDDEAPVIDAAITAHPYGDSRDTITYAVWLWNFGANPGRIRALDGHQESRGCIRLNGHCLGPGPFRQPETCQRRLCFRCPSDRIYSIHLRRVRCDGRILRWSVTQ